MVRIELEKFFERLFADQPGSAGDVQSVTARLALSTALAQRSSAPPADDDARIDDLAAHLDGDGDEAFIAKLARDPGALYELESAQSFLDRVSGEERPVPEELMRLVVANQADPESAIPGARQNGASSRRRFYLLAGSAIAALILLALAGNSVFQNITRPNIASAYSPPVSRIQPPAQDQTAAAAGGVQTVLPNHASIANPSGSPANSPAPRVYTTPNPPVPLSSHAVTVADYPADSARLREQGTVKVKYLVLTDGTVGDCQIEMSSGYPRLDDAACVMVRGWLFKPATVIGSAPIAMWLNADVIYRLDGNVGPAPAIIYVAPRAPTTHNKALVDAIRDAQAAAQAGRYADALAKAKEADAIREDKPTSLNPVIHDMIVNYAINAKDYATALDQIEKNIQAGEGNRTNNLKRALSIAIMAKDAERTQKYVAELAELGIALPPATSPPPPPLPPNPPTAITSHAVTAEDYPPVSIRLQEEGVVYIKYLVKEDGTVGDCTVQKGSGKSRLDDAACTMAKRHWKFKPATQNGKPVAEYLLAAVIFRLQ